VIESRLAGLNFEGRTISSGHFREPDELLQTAPCIGVAAHMPGQ
jgi:hypothetical protein